MEQDQIETIRAEICRAQAYADAGKAAAFSYFFGLARELVVELMGDARIKAILEADRKRLVSERETFRQMSLERRQGGDRTLVISTSLGLPRPNDIADGHPAPERQQFAQGVGEDWRILRYTRDLPVRHHLESNPCRDSSRCNECRYPN